MAKNLVVCLDGTGNQLRAKGDTNVVRLYALLDHSDPSRQMAYYDPGVGTFSASGAWTPIGRWFSRLLGLAFGIGLRQNLGEAYTWLMQHWEPGDRVYVFGFSRGAYAARALTGLLRTIGLMRAGSENLVPYAIASYARGAREDKIDWDEVHDFSATFARHVSGRSTIPIAYLGVWDTVKAAGFLRWDIRWPFTRQLPNVARVRHAVSIDEKRRPYREYLVEPTQDSRLEEVWFAGVHSDVGGTFDDDPRLSTISLDWILDGAIEEGLIIDPRLVRHRVHVDDANAVGTIHKMDWIWALLTFRRRPIPAGAHVHTSVRERREKLPDYPAVIPSDVVWDDPQWATAVLPDVPAATPAEATAAEVAPADGGADVGPDGGGPDGVTTPSG